MSHRAGKLALALVLLASLAAAAKKSSPKCQDEECLMKSEHFKLYSTVKSAVEQNFNMKGKDLVPLIRAVEVLQRRFAANKDPLSPRLNGTESVLRLLNEEKLREALEIFASDEGRQLVNLYKASVNGNQQNLACSKWRINEIEFASRQMERNAKLARVFSNIHKNFLERSARKCLKNSCSSIDENMNRLDSVLRRSRRRKGFLARDENLPSAHETSNKLLAAADDSTSASEEALIAQIDNEPASEFHLEELELCRFFKRSNGTCQASGNELSELSFLKSSEGARSNLTEHLEAYRATRKPSGGNDEQQTDLKLAGKLILAQCHAIRPMLDYHLFGLRWFQRQGMITGEKLRSRTFWCPSLSYWVEIERLCGELEQVVAGQSGSPDGKNMNDTFAY